jgi:hypothetical protein
MFLELTIIPDNPDTMIVLAVRRNAKPVDAGRISAWMPPPKAQLRFSTIVGEKLLLRIEEENSNEGEWESLFPNPSKRRIADRHGPRPSSSFSTYPAPFSAGAIDRDDAPLPPRFRVRKE